MNIQKLILFSYIFLYSFYVIGMDKGLEENPNISSLSSTSIISNFIKFLSTAKQLCDKASENNEGALIVSTWLLRYKLWEWEHKQKEGIHVNNTINVNVTITGSGIQNNEETIQKKEQENILEQLPHVKDLILKFDEKKPPVCIYYYSPEHRTYCSRLGEGIEVANGGRGLSFINGVGSYVGISKRTDDDLEYTPLVRYGEVAGSVADTSEALAYISKHVHRTKVGGYLELVPDEVAYMSKRVAAGIVGITLATEKNKHMRPEEVLTYRGLEFGARFGKEYLAPENTMVKDAFNSVQEAAQRYPYVLYLTRTMSSTDTIKDSNALNALTTTGLNAGIRFAGKQVGRLIENTERGKEIKDWINENVDEIAQDFGEETFYTVATVGGIALGKSYGPYCALL